MARTKMLMACVVPLCLALLVTPAATAEEDVPFDVDARPVTPPAPSYPWLAVVFDIEGACDVLFSISETGQPFGLTAQCSHPVFCETSLASVARTQFIPARRSGQPTARTNVVYPLEFHIDGVGDVETLPRKACAPARIS